MNAILEQKLVWIATDTIVRQTCGAYIGAERLWSELKSISWSEIENLAADSSFEAVAA